MALATPEDVAATLRRDLTESEEEGLESLLDEASDLVVGWLHPCPIPTPTPEPITRVVAAMVVAVLTRPAAILPDTQSLTAGSFGTTFAAGTTSPGPYLTAALKQRLRPFRCGNGMVSVGMVSDRSAL